MENKKRKKNVFLAKKLKKVKVLILKNRLLMEKKQ